jgi:isoleucyl-tRNA synthetase
MIEEKKGVQSVSSKVNFVKLEHKILKFWENNDSFKKLVEKNKGNKHWSFLDGPITANNPMGVHHAWGRTYKDMFQRYHAMLGHDQRYQNGFDCQGLWVEVNVEKDKGFKSKTDIEEYGIDKFVQDCKDRVHKFSQIQTKQSIRLGQWMDWDNSYFTMSEENNYTIWNFLKKCYEKGYIYRGHDVMPWCIDCGAAMSDMEVADGGYREKNHETIYVIYPIKGREKENILIWTTTPWTLPANTAAAVNKDMDYAKVEHDGQIYYMAKARVDHIVGKDANVLDILKGRDLIGLEFEGPFDELPIQKEVIHRIVEWDEVTDDEGTGIVHMAPGCGKEDFGVSKDEGISVIAPIDEFGYYKKGFDWLTGRNVREVDEGPITKNLQEKGRIFKIEDYTHRYPICWRHKTDLVFRLVDEWFISMGEKDDPERKGLRYQIMDVIKDIEWIPGFGYDREYDWLKNMEDWMISKKRYWGLALPIYVCENCNEFEVIGGREELKEKAVEGWDEFDGYTPHKPHIDKVKIKCSKCGGTANRIPDVGNPWLDAGIVPYSTMGYNSDREFWKKWFPADFICESFPGQFRNWFYALLAMSTVMTNRAPFKQILGYATVKDVHGKDMHKSTGNAIEFNIAADEMGVDAMRWLYMSQNPERNLLFGFETAKESRKKIITLWNIYSFYCNYANIDKFDPTEHKLDYSQRPMLDRWILSRLNKIIKIARMNYENTKVYLTIDEIERFLEDVSNWYVRRSRRRFWKGDFDKDKTSAYLSLHETLFKLSQVLAPIIPFVTEDIYQNLVRSTDENAPESIHHTDFPEVNDNLIDEILEKEINIIQKVVEMGRACRWEKKIKVRQPLSKLYIKIAEELSDRGKQELLKDVREELNIKEIDFTDDMTQFVYYSVKPNFKAGIGKRLGDKVKDLQKKLQTMESTHELAKEVLDKGEIDLELNVKIYEKNDEGKKVPVGMEKETIKLHSTDLLIEENNRQDVVMNSDGDYSVALDISMTDELLEEGLVRDIIRHIQETRKSQGFEIEDRIKIDVDTSDKIKSAMNTHINYIKDETLAVEVSFNKIDGHERKVTIDLKEFDSDNVEKVHLLINKA